MHQHRRGAEPLGRRGDLAHPVGRGRIDHQRHGDPTGADDRIGDGMRRLRIGPAAVQCGARVGDHDGEPLRAGPAGDGRAAAPAPGHDRHVVRHQSSRIARVGPDRVARV
jgi:hypothetical protein